MREIARKKVEKFIRKYSLKVSKISKRLLPNKSRSYVFECIHPDYSLTLLAYHHHTDDFIIHINDNEKQDITDNEMLVHIEECKEKQIQMNLDMIKNEKKSMLARAQEIRKKHQKNIDIARNSKYLNFT